MLATLRVKRARPPLAEMLEALADGRAVEQHGVGAILAFDHVAAIARIPLEHVIARAEEGASRCLAGRR